MMRLVPSKIGGFDIGNIVISFHSKNKPQRKTFENVERQLLRFCALLQKRKTSEGSALVCDMPKIPVSFDFSVFVFWFDHVVELNSIFCAVDAHGWLENPCRDVNQKLWHCTELTSCTLLRPKLLNFSAAVFRTDFVCVRERQTERFYKQEKFMVSHAMSMTLGWP